MSEAIAADQLTYSAIERIVIVGNGKVIMRFAGPLTQRAIEERDRMLAVAGLEACGDMYRGELAIDDPRVSPLFGEFEGLPPMAIFSGTSDILLVDGRRFAQKLEQPGMPDHIYREYEDMFHVWMLLPIPEARRARDETVAFIQAHRTIA